MRLHLCDLERAILSEMFVGHLSYWSADICKEGYRDLVASAGIFCVARLLAASNTGLATWLELWISLYKPSYLAT